MGGGGRRGKAWGGVRLRVSYVSFLYIQQVGVDGLLGGRGCRAAARGGAGGGVGGVNTSTQLGHAPCRQRLLGLGRGQEGALAPATLLALRLLAVRVEARQTVHPHAEVLLCLPLHDSEARQRLLQDSAQSAAGGGGCRGSAGPALSQHAPPVVRGSVMFSPTATASLIKTAAQAEGKTHGHTSRARTRTHTDARTNGRTNERTHAKRTAVMLSLLLLGVSQNEKRFHG